MKNYRSMAMFILLCLVVPIIAFGLQATINVPNGTGLAVRTGTNQALQAIATHFSGTTEPSTRYAYQFWIDTSVTPALMKARNGANNAWITLGYLSETDSKFWAVQAATAANATKFAGLSSNKYATATQGARGSSIYHVYTGYTPASFATAATGTRANRVFSRFSSYSAESFATKSQGTKADTAIQRYHSYTSPNARKLNGYSWVIYKNSTTTVSSNGTREINLKSNSAYNFYMYTVRGGLGNNATVMQQGYVGDASYSNSAATAILKGSSTSTEYDRLVIFNRSSTQVFYYTVYSWE